MAKFYGEVGFGVSTEDPEDSGVFVDVITVKKFYGDVIKNNRKLHDGEGLNDDISVNDSISIVADAYASEHFLAIRYIRWLGALWTVNNVEVQRPRLILSLGSVYNGPVGSI